MLFSACLLCQLATHSMAFAQPAGEQQTEYTDPMLELLQDMVAKDPQRADSWRLIGRIYRKQGRHADAISTYQHAITLQQDNAAAHFDLGEILVQTGDARTASFHFDQVMLLAPASSYATELVERGIRPAPDLIPEQGDLSGPVNASSAILPQSVAIPNELGGNADWPNEMPDSAAGSVKMTGYEIPSFDGADDLERGLNQLDGILDPNEKRVRAFIEFGSLYNTNVALTPISRELTGEEAASFQGFLSPDIEWIALQNTGWRSGPLMRGYFSVNENSFRELNLSSFQPGLFAERDLPIWGAAELIGRVEYVYSLDLLNGDRFGDRHAVTASLTTILPDFDVMYAYVTTNMSNFSEDGTDPAVDSLDGVSFTAGISRFYQTGRDFMPTWSLGVDIESADTEGANFRYQSVSLHSDVTFQIAERLSLVPRAGVGYRGYNDFTGPVNRDELTWRVGGKLRWKWSDSLSSALVVGHNRFASDNDQFDTERTEAGIVFTFLR